MFNFLMLTAEAETKPSAIEIISCISGIATALAALAALATCIITIHFNRPRIKVKLDKAHYYIWQNKSVGLIALTIFNQTGISGMIDDMYVVLDDKEYQCDMRNTNYSMPFGTLRISCGTDDLLYRNTESSRLKVPLVAKGNSSIYGHIFVPNFIISNSQTLNAKLVIHFAHRHYNKNLKITFTREPVNIIFER